MNTEVVLEKKVPSELWPKSLSASTSNLKKGKFSIERENLDVYVPSYARANSKQKFKELFNDKENTRFKVETESNKIQLRQTLEELGVRFNNENFWKNLNEDVANRSMSFDDLQQLLYHCLDVMRRDEFARSTISDWRGICSNFQSIFQDCKDIAEGVLSFFSQTLNSDKNHWAMAVETTDGRTYCLGDFYTEFTMQACAKPLMYCLAVELLGADEVSQYMHCEPSGAKVNAFQLADDHKPFNPFVNSKKVPLNFSESKAGAMVTCSLIQPDLDVADRFLFVQDFFSSLAGGAKIGFNNAAFLAERSMNDRNKALSYFLNEHKAFPRNTNLVDTLDFYYQTQSIEVNVKTMASIAATLANGGISPKTGRRMLSNETVRDCLVLLFSCGMYDYSGQWAFEVGLPAKSSPSGCMFVVIPNICGICLYSPPLDSKGNSVRGVEFCKRLTKKYNFHIFDQLVGSGQDISDAAERNESSPQQILHAAASGDIKTLEILLEEGSSVNMKDYDHRTPLHLAASQGHFECVKYLVSKGANVEALDRWTNTPFEDAKRAGFQDIAQFLHEQLAIDKSIEIKEN